MFYAQQILCIIEDLFVKPSPDVAKNRVMTEKLRKSCELHKVARFVVLSGMSCIVTIGAYKAL